MAEEAFQYWAFISYSHRDKSWGEWLHRCIETYPVPPSLVGQQAERGYQVPARLFPVFRDREELPTSADLGESIHAALRGSRYLVVICSPHAAASVWVNEEIRYFKSLGREHRILCLIVDGEPNASEKEGSAQGECFPEAIRFRVAEDGSLLDQRVEPVAADARKGRDEKDDARLKVLAGLLGVGFDQLKQRDQLRRQKKARLFLATASVLLLIISALAIASFLQWRKAERSLREARHNFGLSLAERAEAAFDRHRVNEGHLYAMYAYPLLIPGRDDDRAARVLGDLISHPTWRLRQFSETDDGAGLLEFSPDGKTLGIALSNGSFRLWDLALGKERALLKGHRSKVVHAVFSPDGAQLATSDEGGSLRFWKVATGKEVTSSDLRVTAFSPEFGTVAVARAERDGFEVWDWKSARRKAVVKSIGEFHGSEPAAFSPDGNTVAVAESGKWGILRLCNLATGKIRDLRGHEDHIWALAFSAKGDWLASASSDQTVRIWNVAEGTQRMVIRGHTARVTGLAFAPGDDTLATYSPEEAALRIWQIGEDAEAAKEIAVLTQGAGSPAFSPDGRFLATNNGGMHLWAIPGPKVSARVEGDDGWTSRMVRFSPDGKLMVSSDHTQGTSVWDTGTRAWLGRLEGLYSREVRFSPDARTMVASAGSFDTIDAVSVWDLATMNEKKQLSGKIPPSSKVGFSLDGKALVVDGRLLDPETAAALPRRGEAAPPYQEPVCKELEAVEEEDYSIRVKTRDGGRTLAILRGHKYGNGAVAVAPDCRTLAAAAVVWDGNWAQVDAQDTVLKVWDLQMLGVKEWSEYIRSEEKNFRLRLEGTRLRPLH